MTPLCGLCLAGQLCWKRRQTACEGCSAFSRWGAGDRGMAMGTKVALLALQAVQVVFILGHDWVPLGRFSNLAMVRASDTRAKLVGVTVLSALPFALPSGGLLLVWRGSRVAGMAGAMAFLDVLDHFGCGGVRVVRAVPAMAQSGALGAVPGAVCGDAPVLAGGGMGLRRIRCTWGITLAWWRQWFCSIFCGNRVFSGLLGSV